MEFDFPIFVPRVVRGGVPFYLIGYVDAQILLDFFLEGEDETIECFPTGTKYEHLVVCRGIFESLSQARKTTYKGDVPEGIHVLGPRHRPFWCWHSPIPSFKRFTFEPREFLR